MEKEADRYVCRQEEKGNKITPEAYTFSRAGAKDGEKNVTSQRGKAFTVQRVNSEVSRRAQVRERSWRNWSHSRGQRLR